MSNLSNSSNSKRSISQVIFRHTPGSLIAVDEHNVNGIVSEIKGDIDKTVDKRVLYKQINWYLDKWRSNVGADERVRGYKDIEEDTIIAIKPTEVVLWDIFPYYFECINKDCLVVSEPKDTSGKCSRCGSALRQIKYVWIHLCGHIRPFYPLKQKKCPHHQRKFLYLNDTGRFQTSTWRCRECDYESSIGMLPCTDPLCISKRTNDKEKYLRATVWNDPWVYYPHVLTIVNLNANEIEPVMNSPFKDDLLVSAYLGNIEVGRRNLRERAIVAEQGGKCISCGSNLPLNANYCFVCGKAQGKKINVENGRTQSIKFNFQQDSDIVHFSVLRDLERTVSAIEINCNGELTKKNNGFNTNENITDVFSRMGISDIFLIGDFPLTYATIGYSRYQSKPPAWLQAFTDPSRTDTRIPVYTNSVTTEAWLVQLSAIKILDWLLVNEILNEADIEKDIRTNEEKAKQWFLNIFELETEVDKKNVIYPVVEELIHSYSHLLLQSIAAESGLEVSGFGEMLFINVLSFVIYAGETDTGGITAAFSQTLDLVLENTNEQYRTCKFDPSCSEDDGSACVGCMYLPRGCVFFNEGISRSYLYGGNTGDLSLSFVKEGYFDL